MNYPHLFAYQRCPVCEQDTISRTNARPSITQKEIPSFVAHKLFERWEGDYEGADDPLPEYLDRAYEVWEECEALWELEPSS